jgi:hypothetical protein
VFHFLDRFLAPLLGQILVAPIVEQAVMQPILIYRRELVAQRFVEIVDDLGLAIHGAIHFGGAQRALMRGSFALA